MPLFKNITSDKNNIYILKYTNFFCEDAIEKALKSLQASSSFSFSAPGMTLVRVEVLPEYLESFVKLLKQNQLIEDATVPKINSTEQIEPKPIAQPNTDPNKIITIIHNDRQTHIKSLILSSRISENTSEKEVYDISIKRDDGLPINSALFMLIGGARNTLLHFCNKNRFFIGPKFLEQIVAFFDGNFPQVKLPDENEVIHELCRLASDEKYDDMVQVLNGIERFSLTQKMLALNGLTNPLNVLLRNLVVFYSYTSSFAHRETLLKPIDDYSQLIPAINLLRDKGFYLSRGVYPHNSPPNEHQTRLMVDCFLQLRRQVDNRRRAMRNKEIKSTLTKTPLWQFKSPEFIKKSYPLVPSQFSNFGLNRERYKAYQDYFMKINKLLSDPLRCMTYLKHIEEHLSKRITFDPKNFQSEFWIVSACFAFPLPPKHFQSIKKNNALRKLLINLWNDTENNRSPEVRLLGSSDFWKTFGFIDKKIADKLICDGEMFWELGYALNGNIHGSATHPLQIEIMIQAHLQGHIPFPNSESIQDVLKVMVKEMGYSNGSVWQSLLDRANMENFCSPIYMQSFMMNVEAEVLCPTLSFYFRESFWRHYLVTSKEYELEIEGQILLDLLAEGQFTHTMRFSYTDLLAYYQRKQATLEFYPGSHTLFKKVKFQSMETSPDDIKNKNLMTI
jgi:hypothetical protein